MAVTMADAATHDADSGDRRWQESYYLGWYDAQQRVGGAHHISRNPVGGAAHVWSWLTVDGVVVGRAQEPALPCPEAGLLDVRVGSLRLDTRTLLELTLGATFDDASVDLAYTAFCDPVDFSLDGEGVALGGRHYETTGRVRGRVTVDGHSIEVDAGAWQDHSWGVRELGSIPASRFLFAVFGESLAMSAHLLVSTTGATTVFGWVYDAGRVSHVRRFATPAVVADDGLSPVSCDVRIHCVGGGGYRLAGTVDSTVLMGGADWTDGDWFGMDGMTQFECGGRLGEGIFEVCELKSLLPAQRASLALR